MVFFNYSTMQMAAKIVYYGPGLGGKTTNLQHIYRHTSQDSRGEMVSLETDTDRTLFFDLLPLDIGKIQGFNTRIQLYTVPGQVFYNTTRKLVLKGVDGVVFVADSQRPMLRANMESFKNLEENLQEIGLPVGAIPLVLQYNKRDLPDICSVAEMNEALNEGNWPSFEAAAIHGNGVFETLRAVSKQTLRALKERLASTSTQTGTRKRVSTATAAPPRPAPTPSAPPPAGEPPARPRAPVASNPVASAPATPPSAPAVAATAAASRPRGDILEELEKIRSQAKGAPAAPARNGTRRIDQDFSFHLSKDRLHRASRLRVSLRLEDSDQRLVDVFEEGFDVDDPATIEHLLLRLNIALEPRE